MKLFGSKKSKSKIKGKSRNKDQNQAASTTTPTKTEDANYAFKGKEFGTTPNASSQQEGSKQNKKKRFRLFKSNQSKKSSQRNSADENVVTTTTTTPSTVRTDFDDQQQQQQQQQQEDYDGDYPDHFVTVIPVGDEVGNYNRNQSAAAATAAAATRIMETNTETIKKKEEELKETLSWVRNLLQELDTAEVDPNDEDAEGTELVLPGTVYENVNDDTIVAEEENEDDNDDEQVMVQQKITIGNAIQITDGKNDDDDDDDDDDKVLNETEDKRYGNNDNDDPRNHSILNDDGEEEEEDGNDKIQEKTDSQQPTNSSFLNNSNNINNVSCTSSILSAAFNCTQEDVENCATLPDNISGIMPTACQPIINKHTSLYKQTKSDSENNKMLDDGRRSNNPNDYYLNDRSFDAKFAGEFLHGMLNVGYTLIYHKSIDDENWVGRTVNLIYRPGICSTRTIIQPVIEWKTMTGGTSTVVETRTMKLLNIDAISTSNARGDERQPTLTTSDATTNWCNSTLAPGGMGDLEDEFDSFFTITSQDGEIHLFEALTTEDAQRIVAGIRCNAYRLSNLLIEGNSNALMTDFYDNTGEPTETRLSAPEAMNRLSHAFLDDS